MGPNANNSGDQGIYDQDVLEFLDFLRKFHEALDLMDKPYYRKSEGKKYTLNTEHPDCAEYRVLFYSIWDRYRELEEKEEAKYPDFRGQDHPVYGFMRPIHKKCCRATEALQEKFAYLFTVEEDE